MADNEHQNILWAEKAAPLRVRVVKVGGKRTLERIPQATSGPASRFVVVVDPSGNVCNVPLTNAAADTDTDGPYARRMRRKFVHQGWFERDLCPVALVMVGQLTPGQLRADHDLSKPCQRVIGKAYGQCAHSLAEEQARKTRHAGIMAERLPKLRDTGEALIEAQQMSAQNTRELVHGMGEAFKDALEAVAGKSSDRGKRGPTTP